MIEEEFLLDFQRQSRLGFDEAIFCQGKRVEQIEGILANAKARDCGLLLTRLQPTDHESLSFSWKQDINYDPLSHTGFYAWKNRGEMEPRVAIVSAGSTDVPVAQEVARTLTYYHVGHERFLDVGVAGLWRILSKAERLREFDVVVVAAGMDGALPSVVGGLVPGLVIAVPTSVGYGVARAGETALRTALASCAPGVVVCNIDNGYGAACAALRALGVSRSRAAGRN